MSSIARPKPHPLDVLEDGGVYMLLFNRASPPEAFNFHWALYVHNNKDAGGTKYHITGSAGTWIAAHQDTRGVFHETFLVGLFQIATIADLAAREHADKTIRQFDERLNDLDVTCRTWLLKVLGELTGEADGKKVLKCDDVAALEREVMEFGNANMESADLALQPRPFEVSKFCGGE